MAHTATTSAQVAYKGALGFADENHDIQIWQIEMGFNGPAPSGTLEVRFAGNATAATKRVAVRNLVNEHLAFYEPGVVLTDASIQISGQPV
jgi:hypothetical protein